MSTSPLLGPSLRRRGGNTTEPYSPVGALWLKSRTLVGSPASYRPAGEERPFTVVNVRLAAEIVRLAGPRFIASFLSGMEVRMAIYVLGMVSRGLLPTAKIWSSSRMLDLVQASFESGGIDRSEVIGVAAISVSSAIGEEVFKFLLRDNDALVRSRIDTKLERAYLATQLSLSIPSLSSPYVSALMHEAGIFVGYEARTVPGSGGYVRSGFSGPSDALGSIFQLLINLVGITSQLYLIYRALSGGDSLSRVTWTSIILIILSVTPALLRTLGGLLRPNARQDWRRYYQQARQTEKDVRDLGRSGGYKQEVVLFGLRDWVLSRWDRVRGEMESEKISQQARTGGYDLTLSAVEEGVQTSFYVLLALRVLPTTLSLGSIRLYQQTVEALLRTVRSLSTTSNQVFQIVFHIAAYVEAIDLPNQPHLLRSIPQNGELLDYESHRVEGGMGLVAQDLSFRYPGADKNVLRGINLTIPPGTTLAIVGVNGGGKTTLVKVLMGLYDHQGSLLLNGQPIASYDPATVHKRTSCLFQDFSKYSFTLRENIGIGNVGRMEDEAAIKEAIERGGATAVLDKVGMEGVLNRWGAPDAAGGDSIQFTPSRGPPAQNRPALKGLADGISGMFTSGPSGRGGTPRPSNAVARDTPLASIHEPNPESQATKRETSIRPKSHHSGVPEQRASLSGGQWQRVALGRAFMRANEADLVVFDEPSASLDPRAEAQLFERIHSLSHQHGRRSSTIFISHRLSTVKRADQIAVVEDGTILECGTHAELMAKEGRYSELFRLQKAGFED